MPLAPRVDVPAAGPSAKPAKSELAEVWVLGTSPRMTVRTGGRSINDEKAQFEIHSAHFAGAAVSPHGLIGTAEVEFSGLPSMILSV